MTIATMTALLREAADRHHVYEAQAPKHDWVDWYGAYVTARQNGGTPEASVACATRFVEGK